MRYFLEVSYKGTNYSGFQSQKNANTIQAEIENALTILFRIPASQLKSVAELYDLPGKPASTSAGGENPLQNGDSIRLIGSSRTDAGVHAVQNFFHFDYDGKINPRVLYKINSILPPDIVVQKFIPVRENAHCRFDAVSREYKYFIYGHKDPFLKDRAFYFPYKIDLGLMQKAAEIIKECNDFTSFSKRKTQVKTFNSIIIQSEWMREGKCLVYHVKANRFLRGMVRALTATMLQIGRGKLSLDDFRKIIAARDCTLASFAVPAHGLFLISVEFPANYFNQP
jgi:tRNA pseudouridine38-40 synthase